MDNAGLGDMANRVVFLVDGFNMYHSLRDIMRDNRGWAGLKWLSIDALCRSILPSLGTDAQLAAIHYFSALAHHRLAQDKTVVLRHETYIAALESTGVVVHLGQFKPKDISCHVCGESTVHHEEKETDVAIGAALLELLHSDGCDTAVLVTGDTDLAPALTTARRLFPQVRLVAGFPYRRAPKQLRQLVDASVKIRKETYRASLFPQIVARTDGTTLSRPQEWASGHQRREHRWGWVSWATRRRIIRVLTGLVRWLRG